MLFDIDGTDKNNECYQIKKVLLKECLSALKNKTSQNGLKVMKVNKKRTDGQTDICDSRVAFVT